MKNRNNMMSIFWTFFLIILVILMAAIAMGIIFSARYPVYGYGMMGAAPGMWFFGGIFMIIPLILFFLFIYWIISAVSNHPISETYYDEHSDKDAALVILNVRYAKGEITSEQYQKMKDEILKR
ncbi:MAG: SHOCT domain-containing protein [Thermoplasmata archaeon]